VLAVFLRYSRGASAQRPRIELALSLSLSSPLALHARPGLAFASAHRALLRACFQSAQSAPKMQRIETLRRSVGQFPSERWCPTRDDDLPSPPSFSEDAPRRDHHRSRGRPRALEARGARSVGGPFERFE